MLSIFSHLRRLITFTTTCHGTDRHEFGYPIALQTLGEPGVCCLIPRAPLEGGAKYNSVAEGRRGEHFACGISTGS